MRSFKNKIKYLIGDDVIYILKDIKNKIWPGESYKEEMKENEKRRLFYSQFIHKGDLCFDVGANTGNRVSPLLQLGAKIIAFEPQGSCIKILKWKFGNKITVVPQALGAKEGSTNLYVSNFSGLSSLSPEWIDSVKDTRFKNFEWSETQNVEVNTLDNAIKTYGIPKFIKIDVEGYEPNVLKGLTSSINLISFEYATPEQTENVIKCVKLIIAINQDVMFNYSVGESMQLTLNNWISGNEMLELVTKQSFIDTDFGDVYAKMRSGVKNES